jgi:heme A synthase
MQPLVTVKRLRYAAAVIALLSLFLIGLGGFVRGTGAGLSCPDWPLCYGRAIPDQLKPGVFQEVAHRYTASLVSFLSLTFAVLCFANRKNFPRLWLAAKAFLLILGIQVVLGGLTVLMRLNPFIVTGHLAAGTLFFQIMGLIALSRTPKPEADDSGVQVLRRSREKNGNRLGQLVAVLCGCVYFQMLIGGFTGSSGAALACPDIPLCFGKVIPDHASAPQYLQMFHRAFACCVFLLSLGIAIFCRQLSNGTIKKRGHLFGVVFMLALQITLGLANVYFRVPVSGAVTHLILAQLILLGSLRFYFRINPQLGFFVSEGSRKGGDVVFGEYTPTKRNFVANFR